MFHSYSPLVEMYPIGTICQVWVANEINKAKATRRAQTICHTKNYTKVVVPLMSEEHKGARLRVRVLETHKFHIVAEVIEVVGLKRPKFDQDVKIHKSSTGSKISFTMDEVKSSTPSAATAAAAAATAAAATVVEASNTARDEDPSRAMYTDGPLLVQPDSTDGGGACCGGSGGGEGGDCCGGGGEEKSSGCCGGGDASKDGGDCCGGSSSSGSAEGSGCCAQPTFDELLEQEEKYKNAAAAAAKNSLQEVVPDPQHHAISMVFFTHIFVPTFLALLLMKLGMMAR